MSKEKIYPDHDVAVFHHNVVNEKTNGNRQGLLRYADTKTQQQVGSHYDARSLDHLLSKDARSYVLTTTPEELSEQMIYRGLIAGTSFSAVDKMEQIPAQSGETALYVPYINFPIDFPNTFTWRPYGLPSEIASLAQNKADFHEWLTNNEFSENTPNYVTADARQVKNEGMRMLSMTVEMLALAGLSNEVDYGLMMRNAPSDGNYGASKLVRLARATKIGKRVLNSNDIVHFPNGKSDKLEVFTNWEEALNAAQKHLQGTMNLKNETRVVMTRLLDLEASPGISAVLVKGVAHCFRFNGQWQEPGESACTGTMSLNLVGNPSLEDKHYEKSRNLYLSILNKLLRTTEDLHDVYGLNNQDMMILGPNEKELWQRAQKDAALMKYIGNVGKNNSDYQPRIYNPETVLIAEDNPRDTNWTLAVKAVLQALHRQSTLENLLSLANGDEYQIIARDAWTLPQAVTDLDEVRDVLYEYHTELKKEDAGFILRMPDTPSAGAIAYTHNGKSPLDVFEGAYNRLNGSKNLK